MIDKKSVEWKVTRPVREAVVETVDRHIVRVDRLSEVDSFLRHEIEDYLYFALHGPSVQISSHFRNNL